MQLRLPRSFMAFVPHSTFLRPSKLARSPRERGRRHIAPVRALRRAKIVACHEADAAAEVNVKSADAMQFFRHREGHWSSWRVTHHLAFRRSESGESTIQMRCLESSDERITSLCKDWDVDPARAQGGCYVTWKATMAWDQEGENHEGSTVFALVPDEDDVRKGKILRDRGYAEIVPIAGTYHLDEHDALNLITPYDGGEVVEKFSFDGPNVVNRVSTVRRFGGFSTATFATETRVAEDSDEEEDEDLDVIALLNEMSFSHVGVDSDLMPNGPESNERQFMGAGRWGTVNSSSKLSSNSASGSAFTSNRSPTDAGKPSVNSAFGSGFGGASSSSSDGKEASDRLKGFSKKSIDAATDYGIDLSKVPPSMRQDFAQSFDDDYKKSA